MTHSLGDAGERAAAEYLEAKGYRVLHRNYRFGRGEIDIIARQGATIVFVEVKTRSNASYGAPEDAVTPAKVAQLRRIAAAWLAQRAIAEIDCRFDVVAVTAEGGKFVVRHLEDIDS